MKVTLLASALRNLDEGYEWYERQDPGTGAYFLRHIMSEIASLHRLAGIHRQSRGLYRFPVRTFPFALYYTIEGGDVLVKAILDSRRSLAWIRKRLR